MRLISGHWFRPLWLVLATHGFAIPLHEPPFIYDHAADIEKPEWTALPAFYHRDWSALDAAHDAGDMRTLWAVIILAANRDYPPDAPYQKWSPVQPESFNDEILEQASARLRQLPGHAVWLSQMASYSPPHCGGLEMRFMMELLAAVSGRECVHVLGTLLSDEASLHWEVFGPTTALPGTYCTVGDHAAAMLHHLLATGLAPARLDDGKRNELIPNYKARTKAVIEWWQSEAARGFRTAMPFMSIPPRAKLPYCRPFPDLSVPDLIELPSSTMAWRRWLALAGLLVGSSVLYYFRQWISAVFRCVLNRVAFSRRARS